LQAKSPGRLRKKIKCFDELRSMNGSCPQNEVEEGKRVNGDSVVL
jgi:hypothetical protein